jgi:tripartite-type tricarboxylate transporter receptor subunit TctC
VRIALGILLLCASSAFSQGWPARPIKFIVASAPGGPLDVATRGFTEALRQDLGQPFVVEDLPAADGMIGTTAFVRTPPDGYTSSGFRGRAYFAQPSLYSKLQYDPQRTGACGTPATSTADPVNAAVPATCSGAPAGAREA